MTAIKLLDHIQIDKEECSDILFFLRKLELNEALSDAEKKELDQLLSTLGFNTQKLFLR